MSARVPRQSRTRPAAPTAQTASTVPTGIIVIPIAGMTCRSCERRVERHVRGLPNVARATASASRARVEVVTTGPVSGVDLAEAIEAAGYSVGRTPWLSRDSQTWLAAGSGLVLIVSIAILAELTGLAGFASGAGDIREGGVLVAGLLGLAAGVSTCMALVGGLVLALSAAAAADR
ncbi:MAG TPA: heavy metal-associated domain-containing protein, partial [Candidatus Limnocylindrales bacterium]|nr:heavy metal-associated domain-containing protein [Candidatus Limnocylindrales bacterium]